MIKSNQLNLDSTPSLISLLELIKPVTWFPPMWAFLCGVVSVGALNSNNIILILSGLLLAGPLVCGMSQAVNDWCDRHVDAINQPDRPIPSGREVICLLYRAAGGGVCVLVKIGVENR